jgi:hypothetical protein
MGRVVKGTLFALIGLGLGVLGLSLWAMVQINRYASLSPAQRAEVDLKAQATADAARRKSLKGTDCEKLDPLACYEMRRQRKSLEAAAQAYEKSDLKKAYDDAGVR